MSEYRRTTYSVRFHSDPMRPGDWAAVVATVAVFAALIWAAITLPFGFDGMIGPGCDWGNDGCSRADYRENCQSQGLKTDDARYVRWCKGRDW